MPKEALQKIVPSLATIRKIKGLNFLGDWIYASNLWHINRYSAAMAFFVGLFVAFMPIPGQTIAAAVLAVLFRCNLPLSVGLVFVSNPITQDDLDDSKQCTNKSAGEKLHVKYEQWTKEFGSS